MQLGRGWVFGVRLVVAVVVAMMATAGAMALTGVDLPDDANERAFQAVQEAGGGAEGEGDEAEPQVDGNEGPDEDASPTAHAVYDVISNWQGEHGCEFGMAVREAAGGAGPENDPCTQGENGENGEAAAAGGRDAGLERAAQGQDNRPDGAGAPEGAGAPSDSGDSEGDEESSGNGSFGAERAEQAGGGRP
jgi:hypothetical protein